MSVKNMLLRQSKRRSIGSWLTQSDAPVIGSVGADVRVYEWTRSVDAESSERVVELRLQRETALAVLLAQAVNSATDWSAPDWSAADWDRQLQDLMRVVGSRLR